MKCPNCEEEIDRTSLECPYCNSAITTNTNPVYHFFKENAPILLVFTSLGTLLSLLPLFFVNIGNDITVGAFGFNGLILLFLAMLLYVFWIILIIMLLFEITNSKYNLLIICFSFTLFIFLTGILTSILIMIRKFVIADFIQYTVLFFLILPFLILFVYIGWKLIGMQKMTVTDTKKKRVKKQFLWIIVILLIMIACSGFWFYIANVFEQNQKNRHDYLIEQFEQNVNILPESEFYNPTIPSSVGLGLSLTNIDPEIKPDDLNLYTFHWNSSYGYFIYWISDERRAIYLSDKITISGEKSRNKLFWTYPSEDIGKSKRNISIRLIIENVTHDYHKTMILNLNWSGLDTVKIADYPNLSSSQIYREPKPNFRILLTSGVPEEKMPVMTVAWKEGQSFTAIMIDNASSREINELLVKMRNESGSNSSKLIYNLNRDKKDVFVGTGTFNQIF